MLGCQPSQNRMTPSPPLPPLRGLIKMAAVVEESVNNELKFSSPNPAAFPFAAKGPSFYDYEIELKQCWTDNDKRDFSIYSTETAAYFWDTRISAAWESQKK